MHTKLLAGAALALATPVAVHAQIAAHDHTSPAPSPTPAPSEMDHSAMDHGAMDHPSPTPAPMDHAAMDHGAMDQAAPTPAPMDHAAMGHPEMANMMADGPAEGSGTSRLPQAEGMMPGLHFDLGGGWQGMAHGYGWLIHSEQTGPRGGDKTYVQSIAMLMAQRDFGGARLQLRTMMSAEPLLSARGYPNLFATGETAGGEPLVDRQHPHDLFMELAARVDVDIADGTTAFLYGGPVAEPALGPAESRSADHASLVRFDPHHLRRGNGGGGERAVAGGGVCLSRAGAGRGPLGYRNPAPQ